MGRLSYTATLGERIADTALIYPVTEAALNGKARKQALNSCDVAFLCLPDAAAMEAVSLIENDHVTVLDTSTAHRTNPDWAYGLWTLVFPDPAFP